LNLINPSNVDVEPAEILSIIAPPLASDVQLVKVQSIMFIDAPLETLIFNAPPFPVAKQLENVQLLIIYISFG
jgi:hypothetical protein